MATPASLKKEADEKKKRQNRQRVAGNWGGGPRGPRSYLSTPFATPFYDTRTDFTQDQFYFDRGFTSFEKKPAAIEADKKRRLPRKDFMEVKEIPEDKVGSFEIKVDEEKLICFGGRDHWLSNFYKRPMTIDGHIYPTVEHYYQACKLYMLCGPQYSVQVQRLADAGAVKGFVHKLLRSLPIDTVLQEQWRLEQGPKILQHGLINKFIQYADLKEKLLETGDSVLAQCLESNSDRLFAVGLNKEKMAEWAKENNGKTIKIPTTYSLDTLPYYPLIGNGKNLLGVFLMRVRDQISKFQATDLGDYLKKDQQEKEPARKEFNDAEMDQFLAAAIQALTFKQQQEKTEASKEEKKEEEKDPKVSNSIIW